MVENWQRAGFGVYVHWPFCEAKCPYCDFNSHVVRHVDHPAWAEAFEAEIDRWAARLNTRTITSVFFGGGTPSLMVPDTVDRVLARLRSHFPMANDVEITLEANPNSVEANKFAAFAEAGVNRVSLGVQALRDADLKALGRLHSTEDALRALEIARGAFKRVSFDLIYARQNQSLEDWDQELSEALALGPDHLSIYQLTIEDGTAFGDRFAKGGLKGLPDDDLGADLYDLTQEGCAAAGLNAYEVSNHAKPGAESRHNLIYWRGGDYLGIGPGAHGRLSLNGSRLATVAPSHPKTWLEQALTRPAWSEDPLSLEDQATERLLMGLRLTEPFDLQNLEDDTGYVIDASVLTDLQEQGLITIADTNLRVSDGGRPLLNAILRRLLAG